MSQLSTVGRDSAGSGGHGGHGGHGGACCQATGRGGKTHHSSQQRLHPRIRQELESSGSRPTRTTGLPRGVISTSNPMHNSRGLPSRQHPYCFAWIVCEVRFSVISRQSDRRGGQLTGNPVLQEVGNHPASTLVYTPRLLYGFCTSTMRLRHDWTR